MLEKEAPKSYRYIDIKVFSGKIVACDASNVMYSFLVTTSNAGYSGDGGYGGADLTDKEGNPTGHLMGLFNRTINFLESRIRPVWVFDGKPPVLKKGELKRRKELKDEAKEQIEEAKEIGDAAQVQ